MNSETINVSTKTLNKAFLDKLTSSDPARVKQAQDSGSTFVRQKVRQASAARKIIVPTVITEQELHPSVTSDSPMKIVEKEPDSKATFLTFKGKADQNYFYGERFPIYFSKIETDRFIKSKFELMTYENDIRKIISDNGVKDIAEVEDGALYNACVSAVFGVATQDFTVAGPLSASVFTSAIKAHTARRQPIGKIWMSKELFYDVLKLDASAVGDEIARRHYDEGVEGEEKLWGIPVITQISNDVLPNDEFFIFSPENYLGKTFLLQDATLYTEQKADMLEFFTYEAIGSGIVNTNAITRYTLT